MLLIHLTLWALLAISLSCFAITAKRMLYRAMDEWDE